MATDRSRPDCACPCVAACDCNATGSAKSSAAAPPEKEGIFVIAVPAGHDWERIDIVNEIRRLKYIWSCGCVHWPRPLGARKAGEVKLRGWDQSTWQVPVPLDGRGCFVFRECSSSKYNDAEERLLGIDTAEMVQYTCRSTLDAVKH